MGFFKGRKSKKKSKASAAADETATPPIGHDAAAAPPISQANDDGRPTSAVVTPPASPQEGGSTVPAESPPSPANSQSSKKSSKSNSISGGGGGGGGGARGSSSPSSTLRPLRLGSFNFDNPDTNASFSDGGATNGRDRARTPTFPPLYREADDMLHLSNLIYTLAELRDLARNGVLNNPARSSRILDLPLPLDTAMKIIADESELLREVLDDGKHEATLSSLESLMRRQEEARASRRQAKEEIPTNNGRNDDSKRPQTISDMVGWLTNWDGCLAGGFSFDEMFCGGDLGMVDPAPKADAGNDGGGAVESDSSVLTAMGDLRGDKELVYAVGVNPVEERITVVFRGSVTKADFATDATINIVRAPDPRAFNDTAGEEDADAGDVGVHQGFYEYLFGKAGGRDSNGGKYAEISRHVERLLSENPARRNYKLYVTGHGMGGALATLCGFYACASPRLPLPVTVVSAASPRVGNIAFARTFAELESQGKIRHLRIANHKDPVTLGPTVGSKRPLALSAKAFSPLGYLALVVAGDGEGGEEEVYYHTGIKMKLFKSVSPVSSQRCDLSYSGATIISGAKKPVAIDKEDLAEIEVSNRKKKGSSSELPMVSYHYGNAYSKRMASVESDLQGLTLSDLYREKAFGMPWVT